MADKTVTVRLEAATAQYQAAMARASASTNELTRNLTGAGTVADQHLQRVSRGALIASGAIAAGLGLSAKAAVDWETAWAGVTKTVDGSEAQMSALAEGLRGMSKELPATHAEIAGVAEAAGQLGVKVGNIEEFTRVMIDLGETTNLTADEAATALARISNIMGTAGTDIDRMGSTIVELGNNSATTEAEIVTLATRLAAAGKIAGLSEADVFAFASTLSSVGVEAEAGGTALSKVFTSVRDAVLDGSDDLQVFADVAGVTIDEFSRMFEEDAAGAIALFIDGLGRMNETGQSTTQVFEDLELQDQRLMRALLSTASAGDLLTEQLQMGNAAWEENTALQTEAEKRYATTAAQAEMLRNQIVDLGIDTGSVLLPALNAVVGRAGDAADAFASLPGPLLGAAVGIAGVTAAGLGVASMLPKIAEAREALRGLGTAGQFADRQLGKLGRAAGLATAAYGIGLLTDSLLGLVGVRPQDLSNLRNELELLARTGDGFDVNNIVDALDKIVDPSLYESISGSIDKVAGKISTLGGMLGEDTSDFADWRRLLEETDRALSEFVEGDQAELAASIFDDIAAAAGEAGIPLEDITAAFPMYAAALELAGAQAEAGEGPVNDLTEGLSAQEEAVEALEDALSTLNDELDRMIGVNVSAQEALIAIYDGFANLTEVLAENGATLDINTEAGRANQQAINDQVQTIFDLVRAQAEQGASTEEITQLLGDNVRGLEAVMRQAGFTEAEIQGYLETLGLTPDTIQTTVSLLGTAQAERDLAWLTRTRNVRVNVQANVNSGYGLFPTLNSPLNSAGGGQVPEHLAGGGFPEFRARGTDTVPAMLTPNEFVIRAQSAKDIGLGRLQAMNTYGAAALTPPTNWYAGGNHAGPAGPTPVVLEVVGAAGDPLGQALVGWLRKSIRGKGRGDVQVYLGQGS